MTAREFSGSRAITSDILQLGGTCEVINVTGGDLLPRQVAVLAVDDDLPTTAHMSKHCGEVAQGFSFDM